MITLNFLFFVINAYSAYLNHKLGNKNMATVSAVCAVLCLTMALTFHR